VLNFYHIRRHRAGKNTTDVSNFHHSSERIVGKIHPLRLHIVRGNVELLSLPTVSVATIERIGREAGVSMTDSGAPCTLPVTQPALIV
jgi:hypothetical protein